MAILFYSLYSSKQIQNTVLHKTVLWLYTCQYCYMPSFQVFFNTVLHTTVIWLYACQFRYILHIQIQVKVSNIPYGMKRYYGYMHVCRPRLEIPAIQGSARTAEISPRRGLSVAMSISRLSARH